MVLPPEILFTDQVTLVFEVPVTAVVNGVMAPGATVTAVGVTFTLIGFGMAVMITSAVADLVGSWTLVAVTITVFGKGGVLGAT